MTRRIQIPLHAAVLALALAACNRPDSSADVARDTATTPPPAAQAPPPAPAPAPSDAMNGTAPSTTGADAQGTYEAAMTQAQNDRKDAEDKCSAQTGATRKKCLSQAASDYYQAVSQAKAALHQAQSQSQMPNQTSNSP